MATARERQHGRERARQIAELMAMLRETYPEITTEQAEGLAKAIAMKSKSNHRLSEARKALFGIAPE